MGLGPTVSARSGSLGDPERAGIPVSAVELTAEQAWFLADRLGAGSFPWVLAITQPYADAAERVLGVAPGTAFPRSPELVRSWLE